MGLYYFWQVIIIKCYYFMIFLNEGTQPAQCSYCTQDDVFSLLSFQKFWDTCCFKCSACQDERPADGVSFYTAHGLQGLFADIVLGRLLATLRTKDANDFKPKNDHKNKKVLGLFYIPAIQGLYQVLAQSSSSG